MLCPLVIIINLTIFPINDRDRKILSDSKIRCTEKYNGRSDCVKKFIKTGKHSYQIVCGAPEDE